MYSISCAISHVQNNCLIQVRPTNCHPVCNQKVQRGTMKLVSTGSNYPQNLRPLKCFIAIASFLLFSYKIQVFLFFNFRPTLHTVFMLVRKRLMCCCPMAQGYLTVLLQILSKFLLCTLIVL